jgi:hypothetical protein
MTAMAEDSEEEISFSSPQEIAKIWQKSLKEMGKKAKEKGNPQNMSKWCLMGSPACLHQKEKPDEDGVIRQKNPIRGLVERERVERLEKPAEKVKNMMGVALRPALPPGEIKAIAAPEGGPSDGDLQVLEEKYDGSGVDADGNAVALSPRMQAHLAAVQLMENVTVGALTSSGAVPRDASKWAEMKKKYEENEVSKKNAFVSDPMDKPWMLATSAAENGEGGYNGIKAWNMTEDEELYEWFTKGGGELNYANIERSDGGDTGEPMALRSSESLGPNDVVLKMPMKMIMAQNTLRLVKGARGGRLNKKFGSIFSRKQEWGLAAFLLHEQHKGKDSKWYPLIRSYRMHILRKSVLKELKGTFAAELSRRWSHDAQSMLMYINDKAGENGHGLCRHDFDKVCNGMGTRAELRWALWVVRRYAVTIRKRTTRRPFLGLVPYAHLLTHKRGVGGNITAEMDNTVRIRLSEHGSGNLLTLDKGPMGDSETLVRYHSVESQKFVEEIGAPNPYNQIRIKLPGVKTDHDDLYWHVDHLTDWRKAMKMPPKQVHLWMASQDLLLYGDEWDEEEQRAVENANKLLAGEAVSVASREEHLMLLGHANNREEAALVLAGASQDLIDAAHRAPQLYTAVEPEDDNDRAAKAMNTLVAATFQLSESVAAASPDKSVQKVINRTRDFLLHGVRPLRGLDEIDKLLSRKREMLNLCGNASLHVIGPTNISDYLLCAVRVHVMNESDVDILCPAGDAPFYDNECKCNRYEDATNKVCVDSENRFMNLTAVSYENEIATIKALRSSVETLRSEYDTENEDDEALLGLDSLWIQEPRKASAVLVRLREKRILDNALIELDDREERLNNNNITLQCAEIKRERDEAAAKEKEMKAFAERVRAKAKIKKVVTQLPVDLGGKKFNITVVEGEGLKEKVAQVARNYSLTQASITAIENGLMKNVKPERKLLLALPVVDPAGIKQTLAIREGDNATVVAKAFCIEHNITDYFRDDGHDGFGQTIVDTAVEKLGKRLNRSVVVSVPVSLADGRNAIIEVREGEQHALMDFVKDFGAVYKIVDGMVSGLADAIWKRLPEAALFQHIDTPQGMRVNMRISKGQTSPTAVEKTIAAFCEVHNLPPENIPNIRQAIMGRLNPGALVSPGKPRN